MKTRRPRTHDQKEQGRTSVHAYRDSRAPDPDPSVVSLIARLFTPTADAWAELRQRLVTVKTRADEAADAAERADGVFDRAFRLVVRDLTDEAGKGVASDLAPLLRNHRPSEVVDLPHDQEVAIAEAFLVALAGRSRFRADPAKVADLQAATIALKEADEADAAAARALAEVRIRWDAADTAFDKAYAKLRKAVEPIVDAATFALVFPEFVGPDGDEPEA